ncbi:CRAL-TRIO domain-containing protein C3H8.02 isoform X2 [Vitis riparia]|uniref:CRAL-TRIO domain-containing protein C3H8.02 isoform X2 n=1 Tax=Vitis riparia TaxID=96939 RepID=UPI00155B1F72|nr:CRAL-TRIO domain-containing protein C3H8.02 isoform X2 [Vitis riparia]
MAMRLSHPLRPSSLSQFQFRPKSLSTCKFSIQNRISNSDNSRKLVMEVKEKLEKDQHSLPVGRNGRDDEDMILWFLKDRKFSVEGAVAKLTKAIVSITCTFMLSEKCKHIAKRTVRIVSPYEKMQDPIEDEKLCVFLIEKALSKLPAGKEEILGIIDLRGFGTENADLKFLTFLFDVFYYYYPRRLGQVLFVEAPFVFKPIWQLVKPLLKSYASLARFCSMETVRKEYFTEETFPASFRD